MDSSVGRHQCQTCSKGFSTAFKLERHTLVHSGEKPYPCTQCDKSFAQSASLRLHVRHKHLGWRPHRCEDCGKSFVRAEHLRTHYRTHGREAKPPTMRRKSSVTSSASKTEMLSCHLCEGGKVFAHAWKLERHLLIHTGQRPFPCPLCGVAFNQNSSLKSHMRTHTGEKPFACQECGRAFTRADHLRYHIRTHNNERPFKCEVCGKQFASSSGIARHRSEHKKHLQRIECQLCPSVFTRNENLRAHVAHIHMMGEGADRDRDKGRGRSRSEWQGPINILALAYDDRDSEVKTETNEQLVDSATTASSVSSECAEPEGISRSPQQEWPVPTAETGAVERSADPDGQRTEIDSPHDSEERHLQKVKTPERINSHSEKDSTSGTERTFSVPSVKVTSPGDRESGIVYPSSVHSPQPSNSKVLENADVSPKVVDSLALGNFQESNRPESVSSKQSHVNNEETARCHIWNWPGLQSINFNGENGNRGVISENSFTKYEMFPLLLVKHDDNRGPIGEKCELKSVVKDATAWSKQDFHHVVSHERHSQSTKPCTMKEPFSSYLHYGP